MMRIASIGAGYVGLTTSACLAGLGHQVCCFDIDAARILMLSQGRLPIYEPHLTPLVRRGLASRRLSFSTAIADTVAGAEVVFVAVGTPAAADGSIDLSQIEAAGELLADHLAPGTLVVLKSTVTVGTSRRLRELLARRRGAADLGVASNPEFLREGSAVADFMQPDRIVVGADEEAALRMLGAVYAPMERRGIPLVRTSTANAELIKYVANAFLALKVGFINDVADLCEAAGGDIEAVTAGIGHDHRIGRAFLRPGPGYGGSCFPKDTRAFATIGRQHGAPQPIVEMLIERNELRKQALARRIVEDPGLPRGGVLGVLGAAFKANTDDVREAPALAIVPELQRAGFRVRMHDPKVAGKGREALGEVDWAASAYAAAQGADAVIILTDWDEYRRLDLRRLRSAMTGNVLFDFRNVFPPDQASRSGLRYVSLGRAERLAAEEREKGSATQRLIGGMVAAPHHL
jgi:UDPglucose 6-dehydrogenase